MKTALIPLLAASFLALPATAQSPRDIVDTAASAGSFRTLLAAAKAAGLVDALRADGPLTVFAPSDDAFGTLGRATISELLKPENKERLTAILKHHVVAGRIDAVAALQAGEATTLGGDAVAFRLEGGRLKVGDAHVVQNDIAASNGVIHVIDAVLLPPERPSVATEPRAAARQLLELAVERGAPRFNDGDVKTCVDLYDLALLSVLGLGNGVLSDDARTEAERARLEASRTAEPREAAWRLRRAIDVVYRALDDAERVGESQRLRPTARTRG